MYIGDYALLVYLIDIDECEERIAGCNQLCVNANGSFECLCQNGYELLDDNRTCVGKCLYTQELYIAIPRVSLIAGLDSPLEHGTGTWDWII